LNFNNRLSAINGVRERERERRPSVVETLLTCAAVFGGCALEVWAWLNLRENWA